MKKEYLGDSVYVETNHFDELILTTAYPRTAIYLEPAVVAKLLDYIKRHAQEKERTRENGA